MNERAVRAGLARALLEPCLLCGSHEITGTAMFIPYDGSRALFRVPEGKDRMFFYALCEGCHERPDRNEAIEAILERDAP